MVKPPHQHSSQPPSTITHSVSVPTVIESFSSSSSSSLDLPSTNSPDFTPRNGYSRLLPNPNHNNPHALHPPSTTNKFRLSLHPTSKQQHTSKHFHRHSVAPPEARQYVAGLLPPLTPNTTSGSLSPSSRSNLAPSSDQVGTEDNLMTTMTHPNMNNHSNDTQHHHYDNPSHHHLPNLKPEPLDSLSATCDEPPNHPSEPFCQVDHHHQSTPSSESLVSASKSHHIIPEQPSSSSSDPSASSSSIQTGSKNSKSVLSPTHANPLPPVTPTISSQPLPPPTPGGVSLPYSTQPMTKRRMLTPTFLPFTQITVTNSHIRANEHRKEVISFSININIIIPPASDPERRGAKASWVVEKFYSDVLALDHLVKSKHSKTQNKALAQLPDRALFKDHAPSKVDARKAVLQKYLQSLCSAQLKEKGDVCDFFNSNIVISDRSHIPNRPGFMQGYLTKKGRNFGGWQTRFYVLDGPILEYFDTRGGNRLGHIVITGAQIGRQQPRPQEVNDDSYRHAFLVRMQKREKEGEVDHILCAETDEERDAWVDALTCYVTGRYVSADLPIGPSPDSTPVRSVSASHPDDPRTGRQTSLDSLSRSESSHHPLSSHRHTSSSDLRADSSHPIIKPSKPITTHARTDSLNSTIFPSISDAGNPNVGLVGTPTILEEPAQIVQSKPPTDQVPPVSQLDGREQKAQASNSVGENLSNRTIIHDARSPPATHSPTTVPLTPRSNAISIHSNRQPLPPHPHHPHHPPPPPHHHHHHPHHHPVHGSPQQDQQIGSDAESVVTSSNDRPSTPDSQNRPKISGPMNGAPITGGYRIKPAEEKKAKFRSAFWGFAGRASATDRKELRDGSTGSSLTSPAPFAPAPRPVFGVSLQEAVSVARVHEGLDLPAVVFRCVEFLEAKGAIEEEGIYRLSGSSVIIKGYKERFNTEGDFNLLESSKLEYHDVHAVAGLLKQFLRELASPILTRELHAQFLKVIDLSQRSDKVNELGRLCAELPLPNYTLLRFLSAHLIHVVQNEKVNKMSLRNVGIVFSPTLGMPAPLFALLLKEFDLIFNIEGDNRAPIKLPDESAALSASASIPSTNSHHIKSPSANLSSSQKRMSRNSILYSASGADMLMEHNKLLRSKENINEDSDSDVDYDSSSEPDEEIVAASRHATITNVQDQPPSTSSSSGTKTTGTREGLKHSENRSQASHPKSHLKTNSASHHLHARHHHHRADHPITTTNPSGGGPQPTTSLSSSGLVGTPSIDLAHLQLNSTHHHLPRDQPATSRTPLHNPPPLPNTNLGPSPSRPQSAG